MCTWGKRVNQSYILFSMNPDFIHLVKKSFEHVNPILQKFWQPFLHQPGAVCTVRVCRICWKNRCYIECKIMLPASILHLFNVISFFLFAIVNTPASCPLTTLHKHRTPEDLINRYYILFMKWGNCLFKKHLLFGISNMYILLAIMQFFSFMKYTGL